MLMNCFSRIYFFSLLVVFIFQPGCYSPTYTNQKSLYTDDDFSRVLRYQPLVHELAVHYNLNEIFLLALIQVESSARPDAVSSSNCRGLTQLKYTTALDYMPDLEIGQLFDPEICLEITCQHLVWLRDLIQRYFPEADEFEQYLLMAAAWNAGWSQVKRYGDIPPIPQTEIFVTRIEENMEALDSILF